MPDKGTVSTTVDFDNIIQIANGKTLSVSTVKYGDVPSIKNVGTANDIRLEITLPPSDQDLDIEVGKVETGETPSVKKRVENGKIYLDFVLPTKGDQGVAGPRGDTATIEIGSVSIGNIAKVENVGTKEKAILNFTLPYASGQGSYVPNSQNEGTTGNGGFGGDKETAEELKNMTEGINRSAKATEELETTIANILAQVRAMVEQNKVIISRVVNQSEELTRTLGDRIDANKMSIKAIQMSTIDKAMLDDTKDRMLSCEKTVTLLRGELRQIFMSEAYRLDRKEITDELEEVQKSINSANAALEQLESINDSISQLNSEATQDRLDIELLQQNFSDLSVAVAGKREVGELVTTKDLDAGLKSSIDSISAIRVTANQNTKKISDVTSDVNNLSISVQEARNTIADIQDGYAAGDKANKTLVDALSVKLNDQVKAINDTIAELQAAQSATDDKYVHSGAVYSKTEIDNALARFVSKLGDTVSGNLTVDGTVSAKAFTGRLIGSADTATTATNATNDDSGNNIADTYATKTEHNTLSSEMMELSSKTEQTVSKLTDLVNSVNESVSSNAADVSTLKTQNENMMSALDTIESKKADSADVKALRKTVDDDRINNEAKYKAIENELPQFMLKNDLIGLSQFSNEVTEKLNAISSNTDEIARIKESQDNADTNISKNADDIYKLDINMSELSDSVDELRLATFTPEQVTIETINDMFAEYIEAVEKMEESYIPEGEDPDYYRPDPYADYEPEPEGEIDPDNPDGPENPDDPYSEEPYSEPGSEDHTDNPSEPGSEEPTDNPDNPESGKTEEPGETGEPETSGETDTPEEPETPEESGGGE